MEQLGAIAVWRILHIMDNAKCISVEVVVQAPLAAVWECWTDPVHITKWAFASADWEASQAENDLRVGGAFLTRMQAKDGSAGFDFTGMYTLVDPHRKLVYRMDDGREVSVSFEEVHDGVRVTETFEMEDENPREMQRDGWQSIIDSFKKYTELSLRL